MPAATQPVQIHQIYYSEETRLSLDPGFIPLDNRGHRPDWREYWPMRKFLLENALHEDTLYGFFSPKFAQKTQLNAHAVRAHIDSVTTPSDVIAFSPFFDQGAAFLNTFEQAVANHPGIRPLVNMAVQLLTPGVDPQALVMDSRHIVFCNYFVATPRFWRAWLHMCEKLFSAAEARGSALGDALNAGVSHDHYAVDAKVFIIERVVSLMLATNSSWRVAHFNSMRLPLSGSPVSRFGADLVTLDSLKMAANVTAQLEYMQVYISLRDAVLQKCARPGA